MKELTKEKAVELHRKLWDEIYIFLSNNKDNHDKIFEQLETVKLACLKKILYDMGDEAYDYDFIVNGLVHVCNYCFLCEYKLRFERRLEEALNKLFVVSRCDEVCPLTNCYGHCLNGLYADFKRVYSIKDYRNCLDIATRIRDLPE